MQILEDRTLLAVTVFVDFADFETQLNVVSDDADVDDFNPGEVDNLKDRIVSRLETAYSDWPVTFVTTQPTEGVFETIKFGVTEEAITGASNDLLGNSSTSVLGLVDILNQRKGETAWVFTENFEAFVDEFSGGESRNEQLEELGTSLGNVAAHELGHLFGLLHQDVYGDASIDPSNTADEQNRHIMASHATTGATELDKENGNATFSEFSLLKLGFASDIGTQVATVVRDNDHDTLESALDITIGGNGIAIQDDLSSDQQRYFKFSGSAGQKLTIQVDSMVDRNLSFSGDEVDTELKLYREDGTTLVASASDTKHDEDSFGDGPVRSLDPMLLNVELPETEDYFIRVGYEDEGLGEFTMFAMLQGATINSNGCLEIHGVNGDYDDVISVTTDAAETVVLINGVEQRFDSADYDEICIFAGAGDDNVTVDSSITKKATIEGGAGSDELRGGSGDDSISGGDGYFDIIYGGLGDDNIQGGGGTDRIRGEGGEDTISGGDGCDIIHGGSEADVITGGSGDDILVGDGFDSEGIPYSNPGDQITGGTGRDRVDGILDNDPREACMGAEMEVSDQSGVTLENGVSVVDFGTTTVGTPVTQDFTISSIGTTFIDLDAASLSLPSGYTLVSSFPTSIDPGESSSFTLEFSGTTSGIYAGDVSFVNSDYDDDPFVFAVTGIANSTPSASRDSYSVLHDTTLNEYSPGVLGNDFDGDGDPLTAVLVDDVTNGALTLNPDGSFDYTPTPTYYGGDSFTYYATDGITDSVTVTVTIDVTNSPPTATDDWYSTQHDTPLNESSPGVLGNDSDGDGDPLTAVLDTDVSSGSLTLNADGSFTYTPNALFAGQDQFTYFANDGAENSNTVTVTIDVFNDIPVASDDWYYMDMDTTLNEWSPGVLGNDTDLAPLTAVLDSSTANGSLTFNSDGSFDYTPNLGFFGTDSFTYHATDGIDPSNSVTVSIDVQNWSPLRAAGGEITPDADVSDLTAAQLTEISDAARDQWKSLIESRQLHQRLDDVTFRVTDLPGDLLGLGSKEVVLIDIDAAGYGWFIDVTPGDNSEFIFQKDVGQFESVQDGAAEGRIDLLTVALHELGHSIGFQDLDPAEHPNDLMTAELGAGIRRLPNAERSAYKRKNWPVLKVDSHRSSLTHRLFRI